eukprot:COSAG02_NODE_7587_length_2946_cov_3.292589_3_plen_44_part_00
MGKAIVEAAGRGEHFERRRGAQHEGLPHTRNAQEPWHLATEPR